MKALFLESLPYRSSFRVGSHHYARRFVDDGWDAMWLSQPISPLHFLHGVKRDWEERVEGWRHGPIDRDGIRYYSPFTLLPTASMPVLRSAAVAERSALVTVPSTSGVVRGQGFEQPDLLWLTNPVYEPLARQLDARCVAVRVADDHTGFRNVPAAIAALEERALRRADIVFAVASTLAERLAKRFERVVPLPNGVDFGHFNLPVPEPADLAAIPGPRVLYVGAFEYWFDASLLAECARNLPEVSFVLIGPVSTGLGQTAALPNVHVMGSRPYEVLPGYLQHCDAGIIPFARDPMVDSIHPIKVYEYLAAGLPVVSVPWTELERMAAPIVLAEPQEFPEALRRALADGGDPAARVDYARANSWDSRYEIVRGAIKAILGDENG